MSLVSANVVTTGRLSPPLVLTSLVTTDCRLSFQLVLLRRKGLSPRLPLVFSFSLITAEEGGIPLTNYSSQAVLSPQKDYPLHCHFC